LNRSIALSVVTVRWYGSATASSDTHTHTIADSVTVHS